MEQAALNKFGNSRLGADRVNNYFQSRELTALKSYNLPK